MTKDVYTQSLTFFLKKDILWHKKNLEPVEEIGEKEFIRKTGFISGIEHILRVIEKSNISVNIGKGASNRADISKSRTEPKL